MCSSVAPSARRFGNLDSFFNRMRVSAFLPCAFVKPAEFTIGDADVRVIKMPVDVEISRPPVLFAPHKIGEFAERVQIVGFEKRNAFVKGQTLAASTFRAIKFNFVSNENCITFIVRAILVPPFYQKHKGMFI
jgi:hypothetical protein